jgi:general secretion pathway protein K
MASRQRASSGDGFVLVIVLWLLASLAALVAVYSLYLTNTAAAFATHLEKTQAESLALAGLELTAYQLTAANADDKKTAGEKPIQTQGQPAQGAKLAEESPPAQDNKPARGSFSFRAGTANVAVEFSPENARIDLNAAPKELLAGLFASLGARGAQAEYFADRIIGWRTPRKADTVAKEDETTVYRSAGLPYGPREAPFAHIAELGLLAGLPIELGRRAMPFLTVYSGSPQFNINEASPALLGAIPGVTPEQLASLVTERQRDPKGFQAALKALDPSQRFTTTASGKSRRVTIGVTFNSGYQTRTEASIIVIDGDTEPYRILSYRNDEASSPARTQTR